jgi:hypothetical protein
MKRKDRIVKIKYRIEGGRLCIQILNGVIDITIGDKTYKYEELRQDGEP